MQIRVNPKKRQPVSTSDSEGTWLLVKERVAELESWLSQEKEVACASCATRSPMQMFGWEEYTLPSGVSGNWWCHGPTGQWFSEKDQHTAARVADSSTETVATWCAGDAAKLARVGLSRN